MRKKFIGVYALMAVLALGTTVTSCVDDTESAAVTEIRNLKLKQLQALAEVAEANATIQKIQAQLAENSYDAELAARLAQAEAEKAQAEANLQNSLTDVQRDLYDSYSKALLTIEELTAEIAGAKLDKAELKANEGELIAQANKNALTHKNNIAKYEAQLAAYEAMEANNLDELKVEKEKLTIQQDENKAAQAVKDDEIAKAGEAFETAKAELVRRYVTTQGDHSSNISFTKPGGDFEILEPSNKVAAAIYSLLDVVEDAQEDNTTDDAADVYLSNFPTANELLPQETLGDEDVTYGKNSKPATIEIRSLDASNEFRATDQFADYVNKKKNDLGEESAKTGAYGVLAKAQEDLKKANEDYTKAKADYEKALADKNAAQAVYDEKDEAYEAASKEYDAAYEAWDKETDPTKKEALKKILDTKQAALNTADAAKTEASGKLDLANDAFDAAEIVYGADDTQGARGDLANAMQDLTNAQTGLADAQKAYDNAVAVQKKFSDAIAIIKNEADYKAYTDRAAKIIETEAAALVTKADELLDLKMAYAELAGKVQAINDLIGTQDNPNLIDINAKIAEVKYNLEEAKADLAKCEMIKTQATQGNVDEMLLEDMFAYYDKLIENAEAELAIQEKLAQDYMARLEAAINSGAEA